MRAFALQPKANLMLPIALLCASAAIILVLGLAHLGFTFLGRHFIPRDPELRARMEAVSPNITHETSMWKAWIGFNASHSLGAIVFGAVYIDLALAHGALLLHSVFLLALGMASLIGYVVLAKRFWFSAPLRGIGLAALLFALGIASALFQSA